MLIPVHCGGRSLQGPNMSCLMTAESYHNRISKSKNTLKPIVTLNCYGRTSFGQKQCLFHLYFMTGLFINMLFMTLLIFVPIYYLLAYTFIRFQNKFLLLCLSFRIHIFDLTIFNVYMIFCLRIFMITLGAVGHLVTLFIKM